MSRWAILLMLAFSPAANGQEWTRFRGPNGAGKSDAQLPVKWTDRDYNWVAALPGIGHSSPVIWGKKLFLQSADPEQGTQFVVCLDTETGEREWVKKYRSEPYHIHARNSFASSTPVVDADRVYVTWATPEAITLRALSHNGDPLWSRDDLGPFASQHGYGTSPIRAGDFVILPNLQMPSDRGKETSFVTAFDAETGETEWITPRTSGKSSYSVPCLRSVPTGTELVLCSTTHGMFGLDLDTGRENWSVRDVFSMRTVSSPVLAGDLVFGSTGSGGGGNYVAAIDMEKKKVRYKVDRQAPYVPCVVTHNDLAFLWYDKGVVTCIDIQTGDPHWSKRVGGNYSGSPVCVGGRVYCIAEDGEVVVLAAEKEYRLLGKTALGEDSRSTPAVAEGTMYLRTYSQLFSLGN